jgi:hypothetical protein
MFVCCCLAEIVCKAWCFPGRKSSPARVSVVVVAATWGVVLCAEDNAMGHCVLKHGSLGVKTWSTAPSASRPPWGCRLRSLILASVSAEGGLDSPFAAEVEVCNVLVLAQGAEGP